MPIQESQPEARQFPRGRSAPFLPGTAESRRRQGTYLRNAAAEQSRQHNGDHFGPSNEVHNHFYALAALPTCTVTAAISCSLRSMWLVITSFERCANMLRPLRNKRPGIEIEKMRHFIEVESGCFMEVIKLLLKDELSHGQISKLLADPEDHFWKGSRLEEMISRRLSMSYATYLDAIDSMRQQLDDIQNTLRLADDVKVSSQLPESRIGQQPTEPKRYQLKIKPLWKLLDAVKQCNMRLRWFSNDGSEGNPVRIRDTKIEGLEDHRRKAAELFDLLATSLIDDCGDDHVTSLVLFPKVQDPARKTFVRDLLVVRVIFGHDFAIGKTGKPSSSWTVAEADVKLHDSKIFDSDGYRSFSGPHEARLQRCHASKYFGKPQIRHICKSIPSWRVSEYNGGECVGYLSDGVVYHSLHIPVDPVTDRRTCVAASLKSILKKRGQDRVGLLGRRKLALAISNGILRLYDTPWIGVEWSKKDIVLYREPEYEGARYACVAASFDDHKIAESVDQESHAMNRGSSLSSPLVRNKILFELGVVLAELELETSFEEILAEMDCTLDPQVARLAAAQRLVQDVFMTSSGRYYSVVRRCVYGEFEHHEPSLHDPEVQKRFVSSVLLELQAEVQWLEQSLPHALI